MRGDIPAKTVRPVRKDMFFLSPPFALFRYSTDWMKPDYHEEGNLL
jgi:hypothetical protein